MNTALAELRRRLDEVHDLQQVALALEWDQLVMMPHGGGPVRAEQLATLNGLAHERFIDPEVGRLLEELRPSRGIARSGVGRRKPGSRRHAVTGRRQAASRPSWLRRSRAWRRTRRRRGRRPRPERLRGVPTLARPEPRAPPPVPRLLRSRRGGVRHPPRRLRARHEDRRGAGGVRPHQARTDRAGGRDRDAGGAFVHARAIPGGGAGAPLPPRTRALRRQLGALPPRPHRPSVLLELRHDGHPADDPLFGE